MSADHHATNATSPLTRQRRMLAESKNCGAVRYGWTDQQGYHWYGPALPEGWAQPYCVTVCLDRTPRPGKSTWDIKTVYGKHADGDGSSPPSLEDLPPFERRIFGGRDATDSARRAATTEEPTG